VRSEERRATMRTTMRENILRILEHRHVALDATQRARIQTCDDPGGAAALAAPRHRGPRRDRAAELSARGGGTEPLAEVLASEFAVPARGFAVSIRGIAASARGLAVLARKLRCRCAELRCRYAESRCRSAKLRCWSANLRCRDGSPLLRR
jgi:hypothetical protein